MKMMRRMLYTGIFHIDTNLINSRGKLETMNQIEKWARDEVILVNMSGVSFKEAQADGDLARTMKALDHIFTLTDQNIDLSDPQYRKIEEALFPGGAKTKNQRNDVKIVFEAAKYKAILITRDGGILRNRAKLSGFVCVMMDAEAVEFIRQKIQKRDDINRKWAKEFGHELPSWTGKD